MYKNLPYNTVLVSSFYGQFIGTYGIFLYRNKDSEN